MADNRLLIAFCDWQLEHVLMYLATNSDHPLAKKLETATVELRQFLLASRHTGATADELWH